MTDFRTRIPARPLHDFAFTLDIINSLIISTEDIICAGIKKFYEDGPETAMIEQYEEFDYYVELYQGLDSDTVNLEEIYTKYFPSLVRRSLFLTCYGMLEDEVDRFCIAHSRSIDFKIGFKNIKNSGFERSRMYITNMLELNNTRLLETKLICLIKLRNSCAHNNGRFLENDGRRMSQLDILFQQYSNQFEEDNNEVLFKGGSVQVLIDFFKEYIHAIDTKLKESSR